jgi:predicted acetyltransferase
MQALQHEKFEENCGTRQAQAIQENEAHRKGYKDLPCNKDFQSEERGTSERDRIMSALNGEEHECFRFG